MVIILEIIRNFVKMMEAAATLEEGTIQASVLALPTFNAPQVEFFEWISIVIAILLSIINAYAIIATDGGHKFKATFYLSVLLLLPGISFIVVPPLVEGILLNA
jgi:archaellum biogenesis protein FlaJ (TadC family)